MLVGIVKGQDTFERKVNVGVAISSGVPIGTFSSVYSFAFSGNIKAELPTSQKFLLTLNAGYVQFLRKRGGEGIAFIPVLGGFKYHFEPKVFITVQAGFAIPTFRNTGTVFCFAPGVGYNISKKLEAVAGYNGYAEYGFVLGSTGIELAYYF